MKTFTLYKAETGERIDVELPKLIEMVKETKVPVYFCWNDMSAMVTEDSTLEGIWGEFKRIDRVEADANLMRGVRNLVHKWDSFNGRED
jgi:hypothetical protein